MVTPAVHDKLIAPPRSGLRMRNPRGGARHYVERTIGREDPDPAPVASISMLTKKVNPTDAKGFRPPNAEMLDVQARRGDR